MKRGFTLIELLAVIIILGIIVLIVSPKLLKIIDKSEEESSLASKTLYIELLNKKLLAQEIDKKRLNDGIYQILPNSDVCLEWNNNICTDVFELDTNGSISEGLIVIENNEIVASKIVIKGDVFVDNYKYVNCFDYTISNDTVTITGYFSNISNDETKDICPENVFIPNKIDNKPVTIIGDRAFEEKNVRSVVIPSSVTSIGEYAFYRAMLTSAIIPDSVVSIGKDAFRSNLLTSVSIGSGIKSIGSTAFDNSYWVIIGSVLRANLEEVSINVSCDKYYSSFTSDNQFYNFDLSKIKWKTSCSN